MIDLSEKRHRHILLTVGTGVTGEPVIGELVIGLAVVGLGVIGASVGSNCHR